MAYTPINWQTGDTITAEKMNKMDNGWEADFAQIFSETVITEGDIGADLTYSSFIDATSITVTYDGTDYTCAKIDMDGENAYGGFNEGPDFTTYPFFIYSASDGEGGGYNSLYTETSGEHTISVSAGGSQLFSETVTTEGDCYGQFNYSEEISAESIVVIYDGTEYVCSKNGMIYGSADGDFSVYPFTISSMPPFVGTAYLNTIATLTPGSHTVTVGQKAVEASSDFADAVNSVVEKPDLSGIPLKLIPGQTLKLIIDDAQSKGQMMYFTMTSGDTLSYYFITRYNSQQGTMVFTPANASLSAGIQNGVFVVTS